MYHSKILQMSSFVHSHHDWTNHNLIVGSINYWQDWLAVVLPKTKRVCVTKRHSNDWWLCKQTGFMIQFRFSGFNIVSDKINKLFILVSIPATINIATMTSNASLYPSLFHQFIPVLTSSSQFLFLFLFVHLIQSFNSKSFHPKVF